IKWQSWAALMSWRASTTSSTSWSVSSSVHSSTAEVLPATEGVGAAAAGAALCAAWPEDEGRALVALDGLSPSCTSWQAASKPST
ncbi:hypothetical protein V8C86DRAFT_2867246, partial [Haematococcus lacustris]